MTLGGDYKMITIKELTELERIYNDWDSRKLTDKERNYNKNFPYIFAQAIRCDFDPETQLKIALNLYNSLDDFYENYYIAVNEDGDKAKYLTFYAEPTNDIGKAAICANETTAFFLIDSYKEEKYWNHEISKEEWDDHNCNFGFKIAPIKRVVSYERI